MNPSLLSQFQGALVGAAIADTIEPETWTSPVLFTHPSSAHATDDQPSINQGEQPEDAEPTMGDCSPGHWLIDIATALINPTHPLDCKGMTPDGSPGKITSGTWAGAIALIPMTLYVHDDTVSPADYVQRFGQVFKHLGHDLEKAIALTAKERIIAVTLARILNRQFDPTQHIPTLLTSLGDDGIDEPMKQGLLLVQETLAGRQGCSHLLQKLRAAYTRETSSPGRLAADQDVRQGELLALMLLLYCFLDTPNHYGIALTRFHQSFQRTSLPPDWEVSLRLILGALLGSYGGYWGLPLPLVQRLKHGHESQRLLSRWGHDEAALLDLGWKLWAVWAGLDQAMITKGIGNPANDLYDLETVMAAPNIIRVPGPYPPHPPSR